MKEYILTLNTGSSSVKFSLYPVEADNPNEESPFLIGQIRDILTEPVLSYRFADTKSASKESLPESGHEAGLAFLLDWLHRVLDDAAITAVGHRIVHGGKEFSEPILLTPENRQALEVFVPLAPLHQPFNLSAVDNVSRRWPSAVNIASFDTAFHRTQPEIAQWYAVPKSLTDLGVRRYGFHGLSYDFIASRMEELLPLNKQSRVIVAHLGSGASMCALKDGCSIATTMGFSALDGLPMSRRSGNIDPAVIFYLAREQGMSLDDIEQLLYQKSGLLGVSGITDDMAALIRSGASSASFAVRLFCYRAAREAGSLATALGGLDALIFTAGIGENVPDVRQQICEQLDWLGIVLDEEKNIQNSIEISCQNSSVQVLVIPTNEEFILCRDVRQLLANAA